MFNLVAILLTSTVVSGRFDISLDGIWNFKISPLNQPNVGFDEEWWNKDFSGDPKAMDMPVPSSYNDISTDPIVRDFLGWVWYQRRVQLPSFNKCTVALHFGSAQYYTRAWVNSKLVGVHEGGHIPFEFLILDSPEDHNTNEIRVTVAVNNTLNSETIPQGSLTFHEDKDHFKYSTYSHDFDYFDYAGLNGGVRIDFRPFSHIAEINIHNTTSTPIGPRASNAAIVWWSVQFKNVLHLNKTSSFYRVTDPFREVLIFAEIEEFNPLTLNMVQTTIENPHFWWPRSTFLEQSQPGMLYTLEVILKDGIVEVDKLSQTFGIRSVVANGTHIQINGAPIYLKGFGMHQDAEIRGRGFDPVHLVRDMNLLKWTGANAIRTSHYPYSEEFLEMADRFGIMVILETPACSLSNFDDTLLKRHKQVLTEMWKAFRNHPSVIMWSLANEPQSNDGNSTQYFLKLVQYIKALDPHRLVTFVTSQKIENEKAIQCVDVICVNRYQGWYSFGGRVDLVRRHVIQEMQDWSTIYAKPVILTEYGAEALAGYHSLPSTMWTENYQIDLFHEHFGAFDSLRLQGALSGEMVWNFADFKVPQEYFRAELCDKGIFTRNRQPKSAAYTIKLRYENLLLGLTVEPTVEQLN